MLLSIVSSIVHIKIIVPKLKKILKSLPAGLRVELKIGGERGKCSSEHALKKAMASQAPNTFMLQEMPLNGRTVAALLYSAPMRPQNLCKVSLHMSLHRQRGLKGEFISL